MQQYHEQCYLCNSSKLKPLVGYERHDMVKCGDCGFVFMRRIPTLDELGAHYSTYSYGGDYYLSPITVKSYHALLDELEPFRKSNKILDVGCGMGFFLDAAKERGWKVYGTEYSAKAIERCRAKGIDMKEGVLNPTDFAEHDFDIVTSFEVMEHINNPVPELTNIHQLLRAGGLFYCTTPNFDSMLRYQTGEQYNIIGYPEHLSYYTRKTLSRVVTERGFRLHDFKSTGISISRMKVSTGSTEEKMHTETSSDERLRKNIDGKWYLQIAKDIVNGLLTLTNKGMTLKGYYIKK